MLCGLGCSGGRTSHVVLLFIAPLAVTRTLTASRARQVNTTPLALRPKGVYSRER